MIKIAVTDLEYAKAADVFKRAAGFECISVPSDEVSLAAKIKEIGAAHVIIGVSKYTGELYKALPRGGVIARFGVGHDGVDKAQAKACGLYCTNTPGVLDNSVAECTLGLILTMARHLSECSADLKNFQWRNRVGAELEGKRLAIIGCGNIGLKVAKMAAVGFDMKVTGFGRREPRELCCLDEFTTDLGCALKNADFISLHIPDVPATKDFINAERLAMMKSTAILINTARGGVLDENALYDAVKDGVIAGAALDVFKQEPYAPQNPGKDLRTLDRVIMTPHIGSSTTEACNRMAYAALKNIELCESGKFDEMNLIK